MKINYPQEETESSLYHSLMGIEDKRRLIREDKEKALRLFTIFKDKGGLEGLEEIVKIYKNSDPFFAWDAAQAGGIEMPDPRKKIRKEEAERLSNLSCESSAGSSWRVPHRPYAKHDWNSTKIDPWKYTL